VVLWRVHGNVLDVHGIDQRACFPVRAFILLDKW
jgi:hypothetical protein